MQNCIGCNLFFATDKKIYTEIVLFKFHLINIYENYVMDNALNGFIEAIACDKLLKSYIKC